MAIQQRWLDGDTRAWEFGDGRESPVLGSCFCSGVLQRRRGLLYWVRWGEGQDAWDQDEVGREQLGRAGQK